MEVEQKKRGPKKRFGPRQEVHLKFSSEVMVYIETRSLQGGYQSYFDDLVRQDMDRHKQASEGR